MVRFILWWNFCNLCHQCHHNRISKAFIKCSNEILSINPQETRTLLKIDITNHKNITYFEFLLSCCCCCCCSYIARLPLLLHFVYYFFLVAHQKSICRITCCCIRVWVWVWMYMCVWCHKPLLQTAVTTFTQQIDPVFNLRDITFPKEYILQHTHTHTYLNVYL